ncbi:hypothetical protein [Enterovirga sp. CN4-39]|uniref:hypothetical protein n=1 Tax=Enterovirga sp. CN4-39 TaxID=3400910 RepID=UPI003C028728
MSDTETITIELPSELARELHDRVARGEYGSESEAVKTALESLDVFIPSDEWVIREVLPVIEECERDPSQLLSPEEVVDRIDDLHRRTLDARNRAA